MPWWNNVTKNYIARRSPRDMEAEFGGSFVDGSGNAVTSGDWNYNPDTSAVLGIEPVRYWKGTDPVIPMTQGEKDAVDAADALADANSAKAGAIADYDSGTQSGRLVRGVGKLLVDEINALRGWLMDFKAETALATNLADFQSRVAGLPNAPDRTYAQAKTSLETIINGE